LPGTVRNLAIQEAESKRIVVRSQLGQIVREPLSPKNPSQKRADGMAQGPEFKPQSKKKKIEIEIITSE
jgi:hypothetical protein